MITSHRRISALSPARGAAVAAVVAAVAITSGCGSAHIPVRSGSSKDGPESIIEDDAQLHAHPARTLQTIRQLGAQRVRLYLPWTSVAPAPLSRVAPSFDAANPAAYPRARWAIFDTIIRDAASSGIAVDLTVGGPPPLWASGRDTPGGRPYPEWKPSASEFGAFLRAIGSRYDGRYRPPGSSRPLPRVSFWAIWNEPNYGPNLAPQAIDHSTVEVSPSLYRNLLDAAWSALQATGHGHDVILIGELAPRGITTGDSPGNFSGMVPLRFVRALYCVDSSYHRLSGTAAALRRCPSGTSRAFVAAHPALFAATGFSDHPYPQGSVPPDVVTPYEPDYADLAAIPSLERALDRIQAVYGSGRKFPIYSTEFGYQTNPPEEISRAAGANTAAYYMNWAEYISWRDPRIRSYDQYLLLDGGTANPLGGFATGLELKNGVPKPTYFAYRLPVYLPRPRAAPGDALEVWGCVRPAHYAQLETGVPQQVQIQFRPALTGRFSTLRTVTIANPYGYFDVEVHFPATGSVRLAWSYPHGRIIYSRTAAVVVR